MISFYNVYFVMAAHRNVVQSDRMAIEERSNRSILEIIVTVEGKRGTVKSFPDNIQS